MEIIQQRLIWLLGTVSLLVVLSRMPSHNFAKSKISLFKIKLGLSLILFGAMAGIAGRLGIIDQAILRSGLIYYLENIIGCLGGWCLVLWGIIEWAGEGSVTSVSASRSRTFAEKLAQAVIEEQSAVPFLSRIAKYLSMALDCDGLSLHVRKRNGGFGLQFEHGFGPDFAKSIENPTPPGPITSAAVLGETVVSDTPEEIHANGLIATANGPVTKCISIPLNNGSAVLTAYYSKSHGFGDTEFGIINNTVNALAAFIRRDAAGRDHERRQHVAELQASLSEIFRANSGLYSPLIISSRLIARNLPFSEMNLYIGGDGPVQSFDFEVMPGSLLRITMGHLAKAQFPFLFLSQDASGSGDTVKMRAIPSRASLLASGNSAMGKCFWIEAGFSDSCLMGQVPSDLLSILCDQVALRLDQEDALEQNGRFIQLLGAVQHLQEKALVEENAEAILRETAQVVVDAGIFPFCRITICNPGKSELKTAALAQLRPAEPQPQNRHCIPLEQTPLHKKALIEKATVIFGKDEPERIMSGDEARLLLPDGTQRGMIVPIILKGNAIGALTAGDFRDSDRADSDSINELFLANIAGLISLMLMWRKEKRVAGSGREGQKRLKVVRPEVKAGSTEPRFAPGVRSRINGPLAGILASCEYLKDSCPGIDQHVGRYLQVIEKNAERIHEITLGLTEK